MQSHVSGDMNKVWFSTSQGDLFSLPTLLHGVRDAFSRFTIHPVPVSKAGFLENFAKLQPIDIGWSVTFLQYIFSPDALWTLLPETFRLLRQPHRGIESSPKQAVASQVTGMMTAFCLEYRGAWACLGDQSTVEERLLHRAGWDTGTAPQTFTAQTNHLAGIFLTSKSDRIIQSLLWGWENWMKWVKLRFYLL